MEKHGSALARRLLLATTVAVLLAPATASAAFLHTVMPGESLTSIAAADGLSVAQLAAANGLSPYAQLIAGSTVVIPPQGAPAQPSAPPGSAPATPGGVAGDQDGDGDDSAAPPATAPVPGGDGDADADEAGTSGGPVTMPVSETTTAPASYVVAPGDTLSAIAARAGTSVAQLAAANGIDPNAPLLAGSVLVLSPVGAAASAPVQPPAVGTTVTGRMTWFGGPHDPNAQGVPASGLGWRGDGMAYYNYGSLGGHWLIHFPWGQTMPMTQIDVGPAPWTGNPFDIAYSALPNTPYSWRTWPNPTVTGTYQGP